MIRVKFKSPNALLFNCSSHLFLIYAWTRCVFTSIDEYDESHTGAYIHSISIPPFKVCNEKTPGSGNGGRHLHGSTLGHCPPRRRDMTQHGEQRASHRVLFCLPHYQQLLEPKHCWRILGGHQKRICLKICVE